MNLEGIRYRFSIFLKQFRIEDLKLLMKFLNEIVYEYKNSKAARLFDLLSYQDSIDEKQFNLQYEDQFENELKASSARSIKPLEIEKTKNNPGVKQKLRRLKLLNAKNTLLKNSNMNSIKADILDISDTKLKKNDNGIQHVTDEITIVKQDCEDADMDDALNLDLIDRKQLLNSNLLKKNSDNLSTSFDAISEQNISFNSTLSTESKRIKLDISSRSQSTQSEDLDPKLGIKCAVCSDLASGTRYGVCVCEGCKEFFRRQRENPLNKKALKCVQGKNNCEINAENRTNCRKCRLDKCVRLGMKLNAKFQNIYMEQMKSVQFNITDNNNHSV